MNRGGDHDPIIAAGFNTCGTCQAESYPVAAGWITDTLILASFDQSHEPWCGQRKTAGGIVLLDMDAPSPEIPHVRRPRTCAGATRAGAPCRNPAGKASAYCHSHDPARRVT